MPVLLKSHIDAIARAAADWQAPDYPPRTEAAAATLEADNRFTEEALTFAINQQMGVLEPDALANWVDGQHAADAKTVGVLHAGNVPLAGLQDVLAVLLTGHRYLGKVSSKSPALIPAFIDEVKAHAPDLPARRAVRAIRRSGV